MSASAVVRQFRNAKFNSMPGGALVREIPSAKFKRPVPNAVPNTPANALPPVFAVQGRRDIPKQQFSE